MNAGKLQPLRSILSLLTFVLATISVGGYTFKHPFIGSARHGAKIRSPTAMFDRKPDKSTIPFFLSPVDGKPDKSTITTVDGKPDKSTITTVDGKPDKSTLTTVDGKPDKSTISFPSFTDIGVRKGILWLKFGGVVVAFSFIFHNAATHTFLGINSETWNVVSVLFPVLITSFSLKCLEVATRDSTKFPNLFQQSIDGKENEDPKLSGVLSEVYDRADLRDTKLPRLYITPDLEPNAFAMGSNETGVVVVTQGLLNTLEHDEVRAVIAHEVGHIRNEDTDINIQLFSMLLPLYRLLAFVDAISFFAGIIEFKLAMIVFEMFVRDQKNNKSLALSIVGSVVTYSLFSRLRLALYFVLSTVGGVGSLLRLDFFHTAEYEADAFAKSIGEGPALASALSKISERPNQVIRELPLALRLTIGAYAHAYIHIHPHANRLGSRLEVCYQHTQVLKSVLKGLLRIDSSLRHS